MNRVNRENRMTMVPKSFSRAPMRSIAAVGLRSVAVKYNRLSTLFTLFSLFTLSGQVLRPDW